MNSKWEIFDAEFYSIFDNYDVNEESRTKFTKITISQSAKHLSNLLKLMTSFNQEVQFKINYNFYNSFKIFDQKIKDLEEKNTDDKNSCLKNFLKGRQLVTISSKREEFLSYDSWKKQSKSDSGNLTNKPNNQTVFPSPSHRRISKDNLFFSPIKASSDRFFVESVLKYILIKRQAVFPENRVKYLQNELFGLENQEKNNNGKMQYLALTVINNGEELFKEIIENKNNNNLTRIIVRKYFLQKLFFLGMLEKGFTYKIEENLWNIFVFMANEMLQSFFSFWKRIHFYIILI